MCRVFFRHAADTGGICSEGAALAEKCCTAEALQEHAVAGKDDDA